MTALRAVLSRGQPRRGEGLRAGDGFRGGVCGPAEGSLLSESSVTSSPENRRPVPLFLTV